MTKQKTKFVKKMKYFAAAAASLTIMAATAQTALADEYDYYNFYIGNEYAEEFEQPQKFRTTDPLRLRSGPSTNHDIILVMPAGTIVEVPSFNPYSLFNPIILGDLRGYAATNYIIPATAAQAQAAPQNATSAPTTHTTAYVQRNGNVELVSWWDIRNNGILPMHTHIQVYDIWSGRTFTVRNFSNGNHADVEPLTAADTEIMRSIVGRWSWDSRPVLVTWNGRTFAAAINTMPHGGSTIHNNNFGGHMCLHFYQSRTHNGNRNYEQQMQSAVMQAFNHGR
ncbi:MAG: hypothetical protein FWE21_00990 [Defluviitaleaceae bacterium]|nr:hypothetical protein [Defluviitaleaceae bacterium]